MTVAVSAGLSSSHICPLGPGGRVEWAEGGTWAKVSIPTGRASGGGRRGVVSGFSPASRRRLLAKLNRLDRRRIDVQALLFVTLTYPRDYPTARDAKRDLQNLRKRFERAWGKCGMIWKLEPQGRGAPHFHLLVRFERSFDLWALRRWMSLNWYEVVGSGDVRHLAAGTQVEQVASWNGVMTYAAKYLGKESYPEAGGWNLPGRWWGVWSPDRWPVVIRAEELPERTLVLIRRAAVAWYEHQPRTRREGKGKHRQRVFDCRWTTEAGRPGSGWLPEPLMEELRSFGADVRVRCQRWSAPASSSWAERSPAGFWRRVYKAIGCSMFVPDGVFKRIVGWATQQATASEGLTTVRNYD